MHLTAKPEHGYVHPTGAAHREHDPSTASSASADLSTLRIEAMQTISWLKMRLNKKLMS